MEYHYNINFPELIFTSAGVYLYTVKELTPSDEEWDTDNRVYRVVVTVKDNGDGILIASLDYPDGVPKFVNVCNGNSIQKLCCKKCEFFNKLPFPMFLFVHPQKPKSMELMKVEYNIFDWWSDLLKNNVDNEP